MLTEDQSVALTSGLADAALGCGRSLPVLLAPSQLLRRLLPTTVTAGSFPRTLVTLLPMERRFVASTTPFTTRPANHFL